jgi:hypothetical protein
MKLPEFPASVADQVVIAGARRIRFDNSVPPFPAPSALSATSDSGRIRIGGAAIRIP